MHLQFNCIFSRIFTLRQSIRSNKRFYLYIFNRTAQVISDATIDAAMSFGTSVVVGKFIVLFHLLCIFGFKFLQSTKFQCCYCISVKLD